MVPSYQQTLGWIAIGLSTLAACFWSFWGIIENFHEGWYHDSLWQNLLMMVGQYLFPMIIFVAAGVVAVYWPRLGGIIHLTAAAWVMWRFRGATFLVVYVSIVGPLVLMAISYWLGRPHPRRWAVSVLIGLPLLTILICGAEPVYRVAGRMDDGIRELRLVKGNGVELAWAPAGPGWPDRGVSWFEAEKRCRFLTEDGSHLAETPQNIWRLPTVEEAVRSLHRHGRNAGGVWDVESETAKFQITPDKESPLWDSHSMIIYWWTSMEVDSDRALRICYNGHVMPLPKSVGYGYLGFRAVKNLDAENPK